ncbi:2-keto-4-pentenoate hydratase [Roseateles asaccharophilus]|uniref:2-keto-4-pentenoate hydratase n=1 Tax=Roseateles asaccharophilus TaxID=582607 RepID=A0ABU2A4M9_9BURK|nr:2-keto-4-pentenoate hydratase [Roseateles asaccharophilus]MDR7332065.1 2-keto-4-pentenoate hydratase [Roseateles asaccharophilus]
MIEALIQALAACHRDGSRLQAADWATAVLTEADAYAVQDGVARALGWPLDRWKSGGAGPQGPFSHSPVNPVAGSPHLLGLEAEVALRVDASGSPEAMCIAVELVASRWAEGMDAPALLRMADFQSNAGLLLGDWQPYRALDWANVEWRLSLPGQEAIVRRGGHSLANPAGVLPAWFAHATRDGATVKARTVVTTGAWGGLHAWTGSVQGKLAIEGFSDFAFSAPASR